MKIRVRIIPIIAICFTVAALLAGCGALPGVSVGAGSVVIALGLAVSLLVAGCGGGSQNGVINGGDAAPTAAAVNVTPTPSPAQQASPTPTPTPSPGASPTPTPTPTPVLPAVKLGFLVEPTAKPAAATGTTAGVPISPSVQVAIQDVNGNVVTTSTAAVTIALGANPNGAVLSGTLTVNAVNGVATFTDLQISGAAAGFTLVASASGLTGATSAVFVVNPLPVNYFQQRDFPIGSAWTAGAPADFNGDHVVDLASMSFPEQKVVVLLGTGDGTFGAPLNFAVGFAQPSGLAAGDVNGDGKIDLAVTGYGGPLAVFLGNGDGTFQAIPARAVGTRGVGLTLDDVDGDGRVDVIMGYSSNQIAVLMGNGDGTFSDPDVYSTGSRPFMYRVADLNGDHVHDIVAASRNGGLTVLLGNGDGTFRPDSTITTFTLKAIQVVDVTGDGVPDVVTSEEFGPSRRPAAVKLLVGNGDGTFAAPVNIALKQGVAGVGDLDGDGRLDFVLAQRDSLYGANPRGTSLLIGNGDGTFKASVNFVAPALVSETNGLGLIVTDSAFVRSLNGDAHPDLLMTSSAGAASALLGKGDGTFVAPPRAPLFRPQSVAAADLNGDGLLDLVTASANGGPLGVLMGNGDGTFRAPSNYHLGAESAGALALVDLNGDGRLDAVMSTYDDEVIVVLLGNGDGTFDAAQNFSTGVANTGIGVADFNGDGKLDVATIEPLNAFQILLGNGDGTFAAPSNFASIGVGLQVGDVNLDGKPDVVVSTNAGVTQIYLGNGDATFQAALNLAAGAGQLAIGDLNGDGRPDLLFPSAPYNNRILQAALGNGDGTFAAPLNMAVGFQHAFAQIADVNLDGIPDALLISGGADNVSVLTGNGDGTFRDTPSIPLGSVPQNLVVADFNRDGRPDIVSGDRLSNTLTILLHR